MLAPTKNAAQIWSVQNEYDASSYTSDNKNVNWGYDAAGNATFTGYSDGTRTYDAAGRPVTYVSAQNWQVYPNWPSGNPDAPALETQDTFDGSGQVVKHVNHTRHDDTYDIGGGNLVYTMSDTTTTTYYLRSTVLGGKTIEELDQNGNKTTGYVYAGNAKVASQTVAFGSNSVHIESTNPVTGAAILTDANGNGATRQEPDPLGRDLTQVPDPTVAIDPLSSSKWNDPMPIEASWGPSAEYLAANAAWANDMDLRSLEQALVNHYRATCQSILDKNPNIGIRTRDGRSFYGTDAASFLYERHNEYSGISLTANADPLVTMSEPQNTSELPSLIDQTRNIIKNASGDCAKLLGKDALSRFNAIAGNIQFDGDILVHVEGLGGGVREGRLSDVPGIDAVTDVGSKQIYLNPNGRAFGTYFPRHPLQGTFDKFGVSQTQYSAAVIIHEFLHTTGRFKADSKIGLDGKIDSKKSEKYQRGTREVFYQKVGKLMELLQRPNAGLLVIASLFCGFLVKASESEGKRNIKEITGVVVAYDDVKPSVTCIDVCETSLIVRIDKPTESQQRYIRIDMRFPDRRRFPKDLINSKRQWQFKLIRTVDRDERIEEFIRSKNVYGQEVKESIWKPVAGAENEKLPFGGVLDSYSLVKNGFKAISVK
jgi:hypothetical protein